MIATLNEIKSMLKISNNDNDSFINMHIPIIEQVICNYCNTDFIDKDYDFFNSSNIIFNSNDNSINLSGIGNKKLYANDTIRVYRSYRNNKAFTIDSVSTDKLIINSINTINSEDENKLTHIAKINYPIPLKIIVSKMINYLISELEEDKTPGAKSEKIDDYSITYEENNFSGFPMSIMKSLNVYRQLYKIDIFNCKLR